MENIKHTRIRLLLFILAAAVIIYGCGGSKLEELEAEIKQGKEQAGIIQAQLVEADANIRSARSENERLSVEAEKLRDTIRQLEIKNQLLSRRTGELKEWSGKLAAGYGPGIWYMDESTLPVFVKPIPAGDAAALIGELNKRFEKDNLPKILIRKIENRKAYVGVSDEELLTQRLGSHGAESYLNTATYSLVSIDGIDCVRFEFKGGDHARPGEHCK